MRTDTDDEPFWFCWVEGPYPNQIYCWRAKDADAALRKFTSMHQVTVGAKLRVVTADAVDVYSVAIRRD